MDYLDLILYPNILKYEFRLRSVWISVLINHAIQSWVDWLVTRTFILHRRSIDVFLLNSDSVTYATGVNLQRWNPDIMKAVCNKLTALFNYKNITEMGLLPHKKVAADELVWPTAVQAHPSCSGLRLIPQSLNREDTIGDATVASPPECNTYSSLLSSTSAVQMIKFLVL